MSYDVFISYSSRDLLWAANLNRRLTRYRFGGRPLRIFFAPAAVAVGESIPRTLSEALDNSQHLIMVVSPAWIASEWCRLEHETAAWRDPSVVRRVLIPLMIEDCILPSALQRIKYIDFRPPSQFEAGLRELVHALRATFSENEATSLLSRQRQTILNQPILPWMGYGGPSFDFLWPEMIIDPLVATRKHPAPRQRLSKWVRDFGPIATSSIAVIGEPGVGKTTTLRSLMLSDNSTILPRRRQFVHARDVADETASLIVKAGVERIPEEGAPAAFAVIVDGLDEAGSDHVPDIARALEKLSMSNVATLIACRADFFDRHYKILGYALPNLVEIVELATWQDDDILDFTVRYSIRVSQPSLVASVERLLRDSLGARQMLGNPMRLTLLLYLMATDADVRSINMDESYSLYDTFYREWLRSERGRGTGGFDSGNIRSAQTEVAHWLNENRGQVASPDEILPGLGESVVANLLSDTAFSGLLTLDRDESDNAVIVSFRHETIGEYLIANDILQAFRGSISDLATALRVTMGHDINTFVRSGFRVAPRSAVEGYLINLAHLYETILPNEKGEGRAQVELGCDRAERLRQQIIYYIGRMPLDTFPEVLRRAFRDERSPLLRRAAALGAILQGDLAIEREYMDLLQDSGEARLNRSVQMVYFGDVYGDLHTFVDGGQDWSRTRAAIYRRFERRERREMLLRWWDMKTLRSFYESRDYVDILSDREGWLLINLYLEDNVSIDRGRAMQDEHRVLLRELRLEND